MSKATKLTLAESSALTLEHGLDVPAEAVARVVASRSKSPRAVSPRGAAPAALPSAAVGALLSRYAHSDFILRMQNKYGGYVPSWIKTEDELIESMNTGARAAVDRMVAEYRVEELKWAERVSTLPDGPDLDYARQWLERTRTNIASLTAQPAAAE